MDKKTAKQESRVKSQESEDKKEELEEKELKEEEKEPEEKTPESDEKEPEDNKDPKDSKKDPPEESVEDLKKDHPEQEKTQKIDEPDQKLEVHKKSKSGGIPFDRQLSTRVFIISHLLILIICLVLIGGLYYFLNKDFKKPSLENYLPVTNTPSSFSLEINNPDDEILVTDKTIIVSGTSSPNTTVVISNGTNSLGVETNSKGDFSKILSLNSGLNIITIAAFDQKGNMKKETRTIFYSEEKLP